MAIWIDLRFAVQGAGRNDGYTQVRCHARQGAATVIAENGSESLRVRNLVTADQVLALNPPGSIRIDNDVTRVAGASRFTAPSTMTVVEKPEFPGNLVFDGTANTTS